METIPINQLRKTLATIYMEKYMGTPDDEMIKKLVNESGEERSLDYYIGCETMINLTIQVLSNPEQEQLRGVRSKFTTMLTYVSYEIERLSAFQNNG